MLSHDVSKNCFGRAHIVATALSRYYDVEIIGPASTGEVWTPLREDTSVKVTVLSGRDCLRTTCNTNADAIYAMKPKGASFGLALLARRYRRKPLLLDIDDWEWGFFLDHSLLGKLYSGAQVWDTNSITCTWLLEKFSRSADQITVSNYFLLRRFGGELVPHFRDTRQFDPARFDKTLLKNELGLRGQKIVLFAGTLRPQKGIPQLIEAIDALGRTDVTLLIVGATDEQLARLPKKAFLRALPQQPFRDLPKFLAVADVVALFQSDSRSAWGQVPAKVFDAMSMAKPIIASNVSDLPMILNGCGEIVRPGDVRSLTHVIGDILDNPQRAAELGRRARQRCIAEYSYDAISPKLRDIVASVLARATP